MADDILPESVDSYIPTPDANGNCTPHIKDAGDGWYWVVCEDCSVERVKGEAAATDKLNDCGNTSSG